MSNINMYTGAAVKDGNFKMNERGGFGMLNIKLDNPYGKDFNPMIWVKANGSLGEFLASFKAGERLLIEGAISVDKDKNGAWFTSLQAVAVAQMGDLVKNQPQNNRAPAPKSIPKPLEDEIPF